MNAGENEQVMIPTSVVTTDKTKVVFVAGRLSGLVVHSPTADASAPAVPTGFYSTLRLGVIPPGPRTPTSQCE
jgi:hypothetical protein